MKNNANNRGLQKSTTKKFKDIEMSPTKTKEIDRSPSKKLAHIETNGGVDHEKQIKFEFGDETIRKFNKKQFKNNMISTTKYNVFSFLPKSLLLQFRRAANIYFLIICILTFMSFSPKSATSMIGTFVIVLVFTMLKEGAEDIKRFRQDKEINDKKAKVYSITSKSFVDMKWEDLCVGDIVFVSKEEDISADLLLIHSSDDSGLCFLDTMNLDGETNLKEKLCPSDKILMSKITNFTLTTNDADLNRNLAVINNELQLMKGHIICDKPNDNLEKWTCNISANVNNRTISVLCELKQLILKGCKLKNTNYILGLVVYSGHNTKIMKNAKSPPIKTSNVMKTMNYLLYSVFIFQVILCILFALAYIFWQKSKGYRYTYLYLYENRELISPGFAFKDWLVKYLTFSVSYSHLIPISLYVALELMKMIQSILISRDAGMFDIISGKFANARTSDLIEELGQIEFVFSDKTGTLTKNEMEFRKCSINHKIYGDLDSQIDTERTNGNVIRGINGDMRAWNLLNKEGENLDKKMIQEFFQVLSLCHSAFVEEKNGQSIYQSSSPDEIALVLGAEQMGFKFMKKTSTSIEIQDYKGNYQIWDLIIELPFDSTRKRMSVIIKLKSNSKEDSNNSELYYLFTKGADTAMLPKLVITNDQFQTISSHLDQFAREGLRTLVVGKKPLTKQQVLNYKDRYHSIRTSTDEKKEEQMMTLFEEIETELNYVGSTAIEDKLQDGVADTIEALMNAGIRVWVLTGDKKETAIEIGKSCKLILDPQIMEAIDLTSANSKGDSSDTFKTKLEMISKQYQNQKMTADKKIYMIIDGTNLSFVLSDDELKKKFFKVGLLANSVICCRVSPAQKSLVVKLAKENGKWLTLSIGDGANDVPMIMEAHIGIGISGKEGTQAVRSADYAISQFRFLQRLLFIHGRLGYRRVSLFICYYFYKNIILVFTEFYFAIYNGFSGQIFFPDMLPLCYNSFWSSWPCIFSYSFERDVDEELSMNSPILYRAGQIGYYFNMKTFWRWIINSVVHGALIYFGSIYGLNGYLSTDGSTKNHWFHSTVAFCAIMHTINYKIFIEIKHWNKLIFIIIIINFVFYYGSVLVLCTPIFSFSLNSELARVLYDILMYPKCWILIICLPFACIVPDLGFNWIVNNFFPNPSDVIFANQEEFRKRIRETKSEEKIVNEKSYSKVANKNHHDDEKTANENFNISNRNDIFKNNEMIFDKSEARHYLNEPNLNFNGRSENSKKKKVPKGPWGKKPKVKV